MSYTRRDYIALARALAATLSDVRHTDMPAETAVANIIQDVSDALAKLNPNFDPERFAREIESHAAPATQEKVQ